MGIDPIKEFGSRYININRSPFVLVALFEDCKVLIRSGFGAAARLEFEWFDHDGAALEITSYLERVDFMLESAEQMFKNYKNTEENDLGPALRRAS